MEWLIREVLRWKAVIEHDKRTRELVAIHLQNCPKKYHGKDCINGLTKLDEELENE